MNGPRYKMGFGTGRVILHEPAMVLVFFFSCVTGQVSE